MIAVIISYVIFTSLNFQRHFEARSTETELEMKSRSESNKYPFFKIYLPVKSCFLCKRKSNSVYTEFSGKSISSRNE